MKRRIMLWGLAGFVVAGCWILVGLAVPLSREPLLFGLARVTNPIVPVSMALHLGVKWYWVLLANIPAYALIGLLLEALVRLNRSMRWRNEF